MGDASLEAGRVHFKVEDAPAGLDAVAEIWLRVTTSGFLRSATAYSMFVTFVLSFMLPTVETVEARAGITLLLTMAGLVSLFIGRTTEHSLASRVLLYLRVLVWAQAAAVYFAALLIAGDVPDGPLKAGWIVLCAGSAVVTLLMLGLRVRRTPGRGSAQPALQVGSAEGNVILTRSAHAEGVTTYLTDFLVR